MTPSRLAALAGRATHVLLAVHRRCPLRILDHAVAVRCSDAAPNAHEATLAARCRGSDPQHAHLLASLT